MVIVFGLFVVDLGYVGCVLLVDYYVDVVVGEIGVDFGGVEIVNVGVNFQ